MKTPSKYNLIFCLMYIDLFHLVSTKINNESANTNQIVLFNIDDSQKLEYSSSSYKQSFDQETINYCNFDPLALTKKIDIFDQVDGEKPDFYVNVFSKSNSFNTTSQITIRINFMNQQADSNQLWYLLVAKSACTNSVVGSWRLIQSATTDTIYCYNRDDTVFGHRNNRQDTVFDQVWTPSNTHEDIYFVIAVFTDETYSTINPTYFLLSTPIFRYESTQSEQINPCPNLFTQIAKNSGKTVFTNIVTTTSIPKIKIRTTTIKPKIIKTTQPSTTTTTATTTTTTKTPSTTSANVFTIKALNQKFEKLSDFKLGPLPEKRLKMSAKSQKKLTQINFNTDRSVLISFSGRVIKCSDEFKSLLQDKELLKNKLNEIYKDVENFDRVEIKEIENIKCPSTRQKIERNAVKQSRSLNNFNFYIQHYILFKNPVDNFSKLDAINTIQSYLVDTKFDQNVEFIESYISDGNGTQIRLENSCMIFEHYGICQNSGICVLQNSTPTCSCTYIDETHFWSGDFCTIRSVQDYDPSKIKLIASISALGGFVILSLICLLIYAICRNRCKSKSKKYPSRLLSGSNSSYLSGSTDKNNLSENKLNDSSHKEPSFSTENTQSYTKLGYESTEYMSVVGSYGESTPPPAMLTEATVDLRYCFSLRNSNDPSTASSTEIYTDIEEKKLLKPKGLVCLTDGSSTSYKMLKDKLNLQNNQIYTYNYPIYQPSNHQNRKGSSESSNMTLHSSSNDTSIISSLNHTSSTSRSNSQVEDQFLNKLAYPREITIFSTPVKAATKQKAKQNVDKKNLQKKIIIEQYDNSHVNYAYNVSLSEDISSMEDDVRNKTNESRMQIRRESSQLLPQSIEKHLVKNFQNFSADAISTICSSLEYSYDNNNHYLKAKENTDVEYNLKDEDAWLPILALAEEQIKKYEAEQFQEANFTESYMF